MFSCRFSFQFRCLTHSFGEITNPAPKFPFLGTFRRHGISDWQSCSVLWPEFPVNYTFAIIQLLLNWNINFTGLLSDGQLFQSSKAFKQLSFAHFISDLNSLNFNLMFLKNIHEYSLVSEISERRNSEFQTNRNNNSLFSLALSFLNSNLYSYLLLFAVFKEICTLNFWFKFIFISCDTILKY